jgi:hypothetical protein
MVRRADQQETPARRAPLLRQLNTDIGGWIEPWNENPRPFVWTKTADETFDSNRPPLHTIQ